MGIAACFGTQTKPGDSAKVRIKGLFCVCVGLLRVPLISLLGNRYHNILVARQNFTAGKLLPPSELNPVDEACRIFFFSYLWLPRSLFERFQSLLATRVRTVDLVEGAKLASQLLGDAFSLEVCILFYLLAGRLCSA